MATELIGLAWAHAVWLVILAAVFIPAERLWPLAASRRSPGAARVDILYFAVNSVPVRWLAALALVPLATVADAVTPAALRDLHRSQPWALQLAEVVVLGEVAGYFAHLAMHRVPWLYRLHSVHHSSTHVDWLASHRQHPVEVLGLLLVQNAPPLLLGFPLGSVLLFVLAQKLHTVFVHAYVRLPFGPLAYVIAGPRFHHRHHEPDAGAVNLASMLPVLDVLFGTYARPRSVG